MGSSKTSGLSAPSVLGVRAFTDTCLERDNERQMCCSQT